MHHFRQRFDTQLQACADPATPAVCAVPRFNELLSAKQPRRWDSARHAHAGRAEPRTATRRSAARVRYLALKIWPYSAIFVVQDDAQTVPTTSTAIAWPAS